MENLEIKLLEKDRDLRIEYLNIEKNIKEEYDEEREEGEKKMKRMMKEKKKKKKKKPKKTKPVFDSEGFLKSYDKEYPKLEVPEPVVFDIDDDFNVNYEGDEGGEEGNEEKDEEE